MKLSGYQSFGIRRNWYLSFFNTDNWFETNYLGKIQQESIKIWLIESEIITKDQKLTKIGSLLKNIIVKNEKLAWEIIWTNLYYNSELIKWYISDIELEKAYSINELVVKMIAEHGTNERTTQNGISALANLLENSPIGNELKMGIVTKTKNVRYIKKSGSDDVHPITIVYSIYRYAQSKNNWNFTISEFYKENQKDGLYRLFGISREKLENILCNLQENKNNIIKINSSLDNINLRKELSYIDVLELFVKEVFDLNLDVRLVVKEKLNTYSGDLKTLLLNIIDKNPEFAIILDKYIVIQPKLNDFHAIDEFTITLEPPKISIRKPILSIFITPKPKINPILTDKNGKSFNINYDNIEGNWKAELKNIKSGQYKMKLQIGKWETELVIEITSGFKENKLI